MSLTQTTTTASHALDINQLLDSIQGRGVVDGGRPTEGARPFAVDLLAATAQIGDVVVETPAVSIDLSDYTGADNPRKVLLYIAPLESDTPTDGVIEGTAENVQVAVGEPADPRPDSALRWDAYEPSPPDLSGVDAAPVAEIWIGENAQQLVDEDIRDRRLSTDLIVHALSAGRGTFDALVDGAGVEHTAELADAEDVWEPDDIREAINADPDHSETAPHDFFSGVHDDLIGVASDDHHARYTAADVRAAIRGVLEAESLRADPQTTPGEHLATIEGGPVSSSYGNASFDRSSYGEFGSTESTILDWVAPPRAEAPVLASGTVTHTGGSSTTVFLAGITPSQMAQVDVGVGVSTSAPPAWGDDYGYQTSVSKSWRPADGTVDVELTLEWTTDPGTGSDLELDWTAFDISPDIVTGLYSRSDAVNAVNGSLIEPGELAVSARFNPPTYTSTADASGTPQAGDILITNGEGSAPFGVAVYDGVAWQGPYRADLTSLSGLTIDVAKDWQGFPIPNVGASDDPTSVIRQLDIDAHANTTDAHHDPLVSSDVDHGDMGNVQPDQHHDPLTAGEIRDVVADGVGIAPIPLTMLPSGQAVRTHVALADDEQLVVTLASASTESGNIPSGLALEIVDVESGEVYYEASEAFERADIRAGDTPLAIVDGPAAAELRVRNGTDSQLVAGGTIGYHVRRDGGDQ